MVTFAAHVTSYSFACGIMVSGPAAAHAGLVANSGFTEQVAQQFPDKDAPIFVACKMGKRAEKAINLLSPDFKNLAHFSEGYQGWEGKGLPIVK